MIHHFISGICIAIALALCLALSGCASAQAHRDTQQFIDRMFFSAPQCESGTAVLYQSGPATCMPKEDAQRLQDEGFTLPGGVQ